MRALATLWNNETSSLFWLTKTRYWQNPVKKDLRRRSYLGRSNTLNIREACRLKKIQFVHEKMLSFSLKFKKLRTRKLLTRKTTVALKSEGSKKKIRTGLKSNWTIIYRSIGYQRNTICIKLLLRILIRSVVIKKIRLSSFAAIFLVYCKEKF